MERLFNNKRNILYINKLQYNFINIIKKLFIKYCYGSGFVRIFI